MGLCDGVWMNYPDRQCVVSHLVSQVLSAHEMLVFPRASFVSCLAGGSEKGWRDCSRFQDLTRFNKIAIQGTPQMAVD